MLKALFRITSVNVVQTVTARGIHWLEVFGLKKAAVNRVILAGVIRRINVSHLALAQAKKLHWEGVIQPKIASDTLELVDFGVKVTVAHLVVCVGAIKQENVNYRVQSQLHHPPPL